MEFSPIECDSSLPPTLWSYMSSSSSWTLDGLMDSFDLSGVSTSTIPYNNNNETSTVSFTDFAVEKGDTALSLSFVRIWIALAVIASPRAAIIVMSLIYREPIFLMRALQSCLYGISISHKVASLSAAFNIFQLFSFAISFAFCPSFIFLIPALQLRQKSPAAAILIAWSALVFGTSESVTSLFYLVNRVNRRSRISSGGSTISWMRNIQSPSTASITSSASSASGASSPSSASSDSGSDEFHSEENETSREESDTMYITRMSMEADDGQSPNIAVQDENGDGNDQNDGYQDHARENNNTVGELTDEPHRIRNNDDSNNNSNDDEDTSPPTRGQDNMSDNFPEGRADARNGRDGIDISAVFRDIQSGDVGFDAISESSLLMYCRHYVAGCSQLLIKFISYWFTIVAGEMFVSLWLALMAADIKFFTYPTARSIMYLLENQFGPWQVSATTCDTFQEGGTSETDFNSVGDSGDTNVDLLLFQSVMICEAILAIVMGLSIRVGTWMFMLPPRNHDGLYERRSTMSPRYNIVLTVLVNLERNVSRYFASDDEKQLNHKVTSLKFPSPIDIPSWYEPSDERYRCPITLMPMREPSIATSSGITYERTAIERWMRKNNNDPMTRSSISPPGPVYNDDESVGDIAASHQKSCPHLVPNLLIRELIEEDVEKSKKERDRLTEKIFSKRESKDIMKRKHRPSLYRTSSRSRASRRKKKSTVESRRNTTAHEKPSSWPELENCSMFFAPTLRIFEQKNARSTNASQTIDDVPLTPIAKKEQ